MGTKDTDICWVGHRGYPALYPENSLLGIREAIAAGAHGVELDLQLSRDGEPMVLHDADLQRVCGIASGVADLSAQDLMQLSAHEPGRLGETFFPTPIVSLAALVAMLSELPPVKVFVELKVEMFARYARAKVLTRVWECLAPIADRVVLISFDLEVLRLAQERFFCPVGWVLSHYCDDAREQVRTQPVDFLIINYLKLPSVQDPLWSGSWQWFVYDVVDEEVARNCRRLGVRWQETWDIKAMRSVYV